MSPCLELGFSTLRWAEGSLLLLDQTRLPRIQIEMHLHTVAELVDAIQRLCVRGAPALGCAAAYGMVLGVLDAKQPSEWLTQLRASGALIAAARPTAVNLAVGVAQMLAVGEQLAAATDADADADVDVWTALLLDAAIAFHDADADACLAIAENALPLVPDGSTVLTHCNAGALATGGLGTALAPLHLGHARGLRYHVFADETRPLRQGARLTAWELARHGIEVSVLADAAAATLLASGKIDLILVGADRIAANGDVANKIGTFPLAVLAERFHIPFYVLAPATTIDPQCAGGAAIPIEQRDAEELYGEDGARTGVGVFNPAFDMTPAGLVTHIITEHGIYQAHGAGQSAWQAYVNSLSL
jgi:methylthioribose-1-phosphate isomerase